MSVSVQCLLSNFYLYIENVKGVVKMTKLLQNLMAGTLEKNNSIPSTIFFSSNKYVFINSVNLHQD